MKSIHCIHLDILDHLCKDWLSFARSYKSCRFVFVFVDKILEKNLKDVDDHRNHKAFCPKEWLCTDCVGSAHPCGKVRVSRFDCYGLFFTGTAFSCSNFSNMNKYWNSLIGDSQSWGSSFDNQIPTRHFSTIKILQNHNAYHAVGNFESICFAAAVRQ